MEREKQANSKMVTIYDIAKEAGVSAATVSRVLNGSASVRKEKKEKIEQIIAKYNFKPNVLAKGLSDTATRNIGIIAADVRNPYYSAVFVECEQAAEEMGYSVGLTNSLGEKEREINQLDILLRQKVDAIIQMGGSVDDLVVDEAYAQKLREISAGTPIVVTGHMDKEPVYSVFIDEEKAIDLLMEHLISLGHRRIALVCGEMRVASTYYKYQRYRDNLHRYGIPENEDYVVGGYYDPESGYSAANQVLELDERPTAIIAINDFAASGVLRSIRDHGLRVPEDISIVSFDNTYITELTVPKLTSIDYDYKQYGKTLIGTAIAAASGNPVDHVRLIEPVLVVRESTGPCPEKIR